MKIHVLLLFLAVCFSEFVLHDSKSMVKSVIGIDIGTTYSCVAISLGGVAEIIPDEEGNKLTPSWIAFTDKGRLIGKTAKNQAALNPVYTIFGFKRFIGRRFNDPKIQRYIRFMPCKVVNKDSFPYIEVREKGELKVFSPEEITAMLLEKMKEIAKAFLGKNVKDVVITVPASFNGPQRQSTKNACAIAGLKVAQIISAPVAAAVDYGWDKKGPKTSTLVYHFGASTFEVSILTINNGVFEVLSTAGDTQFGGENFDRVCMQYFLDSMTLKHYMNFSSIEQVLVSTRIECERAKRAFSRSTNSENPRVVLRVKIENIRNPEELSFGVHKEIFEYLVETLFTKTFRLGFKALQDAGLGLLGVNEILLVGSTAKISKVQDHFKFNYGQEPYKAINPVEAVAIGAAIQGGQISGGHGEVIRGLVLHDVTSTSIGLGTAQGVVKILIPKNTRFPTKKSLTFTTRKTIKPH